jgi:hypothetical protein
MVFQKLFCFCQTVCKIRCDVPAGIKGLVPVAFGIQMIAEGLSFFRAALERWINQHGRPCVCCLPTHVKEFSDIDFGWDGEVFDERAGMIRGYHFQTENVLSLLGNE